MTIEHVHSFVRVKRRKTMYMCNDPHCTYRQDKDFLVGKASLCCNCGQEMVLTGEMLRLARPAHATCRNTKEGRMENAAKDLLKGLDLGGGF